MILFFSFSGLDTSITLSNRLSANADKRNVPASNKSAPRVPIICTSPTPMIGPAMPISSPPALLTEL